MSVDRNSNDDTRATSREPLSTASTPSSFLSLESPQTPSTRGAVKERIEYFQGRQNEAEARKMEEEELFSSRQRSPSKPQMIPKPEKATEKETDSNERHAHFVPGVVVGSKECHSVLATPRYHIVSAAMQMDTDGASNVDYTHVDEKQEIHQHSSSLSSSSSSVVDPKQHIDEMVHKAEQMLTSQSNSLERMFQNVDRVLQLAEQHSQNSNSSSRESSVRRRCDTSVLQSELAIAERQYSRESSNLEETADAAESLKRTRALLAQDDVMPPSREDERDSIRGPANLSRGMRNVKQGSLIVRSFPFPSPNSLRKAKVGLSGVDRMDGAAKVEVVHKEASFEMPLEITNDGVNLSPKIAELAMMTTIPPSRPDGAWSGTMGGKSSIGETTSNSTASASLEYKTSRSTRLTVGLVRGFHSSSQNLISIGARLLRGDGSRFGIGLYHQPTSIQNAMKHEKWTWSLTFRRRFSKYTKWSLFSQLSRRQDVSLVVSNNRLSARLGWNLKKSKQLMIRLDARPLLSAYRKAHLYFQWKPAGMWQCGVCLVQSLHSQVATVGLGWQVVSSKGVQWILSWNRGNATIKIPITLSKQLTNTSFAQVVYVTLVSHLIQECIADLWGWIGAAKEEDAAATETTIPASATVRSYDPVKARKDAENQKESMARQALRRMKDEEEKDGLVIQHAVYHVENGDALDVTTQLQFWVAHSKLSLPARPKSELLGFYKLATRDAASKNVPPSKTNSIWEWRDMWNDFLGNSAGSVFDNKVKAPTPTLSIQYTFHGKPYHITIMDQEELKLPSLHASLGAQ